MSEFAIRADGLGKQYRIGGRQESYKTVRDMIAHTLTAPIQRLSAWARRGNGSAGNPTPKFEEIWALRNISFEIMAGEVLGIIGHNGAGKSTLLKILSRITEPTEGVVDIYGQIASLLEVGTGFHQELTGRENIYLNGAILGMKRADIERKFDEIVAFAEVDRFIDTPVKHFSSGMYLRLAFAVAAHLEPEILIVDEVLAVGDAAFQKKCLGKMGDVAKDGRTVLFVSHNMAAVRTLCQRALVLNAGTVEFDGSASGAIAFYTSNNAQAWTMTWRRQKGQRAGPLSFQEIGVTLEGDQPRQVLVCEMILLATPPGLQAFVAVDILDHMLTPIMQAIPCALPFIESTPGAHRIRVEIELPALIPGLYHASFWVGAHYTTTLDQVLQAVAFEVTASPTPGRSFPHSIDNGSIVPASRYEYQSPKAI